MATTIDLEINGERKSLAADKRRALLALLREDLGLTGTKYGGGFGGKHTGEVAVEAARLAKAAGRPVSLRWSREEEFTWAYFRPAGVIEVKGDTVHLR